MRAFALIVTLAATVVAQAAPEVNDAAKPTAVESCNDWAGTYCVEQ